MTPHAPTDTGPATCFPTTTPPAPAQGTRSEPGGPWSLLLAPGLTLLDGRRQHLRHLAQELTHHTIHGNGTHRVLWCDGDHGFNPYDLAELNLTRGHAADAGADRVLVKRCMTPFQWDTVLARHLKDKLAEGGAALVLVLPYDHLFSTDELEDWEQREYVHASLNHLRTLTRVHRLPILLGVDLAPWCRTHPALARAALARVDHLWRIGRATGHWVLTTGDESPLPLMDTRQASLLDFLPDGGFTPPSARA